jgi:uncharacterized protein (TIGR02145 family)
MKKVFKIAFLILIPVFPFAQSLYTKGQGVKDIDGNDYPSIIINGQEWMQKNLAVTKYRNGDPIPTRLDNETWQSILESSTIESAYAIYENVASNNTTYGKLYNWFAVSDSRGLCPTGWHVPSDDEWSALINYLDPNAAGGDSTNMAGGKLKSTGTIENNDGLWLSPNVEATNESGFSGFPAGERNNDGTYSDIGSGGYWWSSSEFTPFAWCRELLYYDSNVIRNYNNWEYGFSVRCVRD